MGSTCLQIPINNKDIILWDQESISRQEQSTYESSPSSEEQFQMTSHLNNENDNSQDEISASIVNQSPAKTCKSILKNKIDFEIVRSKSINKTVSFSFIPSDQLKEMLTSKGRLSEEQKKFLASLQENV